MIRNLVVGRLKDGVALSAIEPALAAVVALDPPGRRDCHVGIDLRLREGGWDFGISADFVDEASYRAYDEDVEHNRIRQQMFAPLCEQLVRVQFALQA